MARDPAQRPPDAAALAPRCVSSPRIPTTSARPRWSLRPWPRPGAAGRRTGHRDGDHAAVASQPTRPAAGATAWLPIAAAVLAVLLIVGIAYAVTQSGDDDEPTSAAGTQTTPTTKAPSTSAHTTTSPTSHHPTTTTTTTPTTTTVTIDPETYLNRPVKDVEKELKDLGLEPVRGEEVTGGEKDTVADISPTGEVPEGTQVTLAVYTGEDEEPGNADENGHGPKPSKPKEN